MDGDACHPDRTMMQHNRCRWLASLWGAGGCVSTGYSRSSDSVRPLNGQYPRGSVGPSPGLHVGGSVPPWVTQVNDLRPPRLVPYRGCLHQARCDIVDPPPAEANVGTRSPQCTTTLARGS